MTLFDILLNKIVAESKRSHDDVEILFMSMWGPPGSGKTTTGFTIAALLSHILEKDITVYHTMLLQDVFNYIRSRGPPTTRAMLIFVDDAEYYRYSRLPSKNIKEVQNHDMIRHKLRDAGWKRGFIFLLYATQWIMNLASVFRIAYAVASKPTPLIDERETKVFADIFGWAAVYKMRELWRRYFWRNADSKWKSITLLKLAGFPAAPVIIPPLPRPHYVDLWTPRIQNTSTESNLPEVVNLILELLEKNKLPLWRTRNNRYYPFVNKKLLRQYGYGDIKLRELEEALGTKLPVKLRKVWDGEKLYNAVVIMKPVEPASLVT